MFKFLFVFIAANSLSFNTHADCSVLDWVKDLKKPLCPANKGETLVLPETFPAIIVVLSNILGYKNYSSSTKLDEIYSISTMLNICKQSEITHQHPYIIFPSSDDRIEDVKKMVLMAIDSDAELREINGASEPCKKSLLFPKGGHLTAPLNKVCSDAINPFMWEQDHFISFHNPMTGGVEIQNLPYKLSNSGCYIDKNYVATILEKLLRDCKSRIGAPLLTISNAVIDSKNEVFKQNTDAYHGGNILALPNGIFLTGNNAVHEVMAPLLGGDQKHFLTISVDWLKVGHVDEIVSLIEESPAQDGEACSVTLSIASPAVALKEMHNNPSKLFSLLGETEDFRGLKKACEIIHYFKHFKESKFKMAEKENLRLLKTIYKTCDFSKITNQDILKQVFSKNSVLLKFNKDVQLKMDQAKTLIRNKLKEFSSCKVNFINYPALFYQDDDELILAESIFPNPNNSIQFGKRILYPKQFNEAFENRIQSDLKSIKFLPVPIDTRVTHQNCGNLHCATNIIRTCAPAA